MGPYAPKCFFLTVSPFGSKNSGYALRSRCRVFPLRGQSLNFNPWPAGRAFQRLFLSSTGKPIIPLPKEGGSGMRLPRVEQYEGPLGVDFPFLRKCTLVAGRYKSHPFGIWHVGYPKTFLPGVPPLDYPMIIFRLLGLPQPFLNGPTKRFISWRPKCLFVSGEKFIVGELARGSYPSEIYPTSWAYLLGSFGPLGLLNLRMIGSEIFGFQFLGFFPGKR